MPSFPRAARLIKELTDRAIGVDPVDSFREQRTDGQHLHLREHLFLRDRHGVQEHQFLDGGICDPFDGRPGKDGVSRAGADALRSQILQRVREELCEIRKMIK